MPDEPAIFGASDHNRTISIGSEDHGSARRQQVKRLLARMSVGIFSDPDKRQRRIDRFVEPRLLVSTAMVRDFDHVVGSANGARREERALPVR